MAQGERKTRIAELLDQMDIVSLAVTHIDITEQLILSYLGHPKHEVLWKSFKAFYSPVLSGVPVWLWKSHCKEIAKRIIGIESNTKKDIEMAMKAPTRAEMIKILSGASLKAKPTHEAYEVYLWLFCAVCEEEGHPLPEGLPENPAKPQDWFLDEIFGCYSDRTRVGVVYEVFRENGKG